MQNREQPHEVKSARGGSYFTATSRLLWWGWAMEDSDKPKETSGKPNNEALALKQLKSIKVALWTLVTVFVILPVVAAIGILLLTLVTGWGPFGDK